MEITQHTFKQPMGQGSKMKSKEKLENTLRKIKTKTYQNSLDSVKAVHRNLSP